MEGSFNCGTKPPLTRAVVSVIGEACESANPSPDKLFLVP